MPPEVTSAGSPPSADLQLPRQAARDGKMRATPSSSLIGARPAWGQARLRCPGLASGAARCVRVRVREPSAGRVLWLRTRRRRAQTLVGDVAHCVSKVNSCFGAGGKHTEREQVSRAIWLPDAATKSSSSSPGSIRHSSRAPQLALPASRCYAPACSADCAASVCTRWFVS